ncbi:hypothetical protein BH23CHL8_BH23CHL8_09850 [soil metagenome]
MWVSSYCASAELRGVADMSLISGVEMIDLARRVSLSVARAAVVLDCDSGFGDEHIWRQAMEEIARATEVAGVCIEDKQFPKRNSFYRDEQVMRDISEFSRFIEVAVGVRDRYRPDLRVIARTEALVAGGTPEDVALRLRAYGGAGADGFFIQARASEAELVAALELVTGAGRPPVVLAPSAFPERAPSFWWSSGAGAVIHANQMLRLALRAQELAMGHLLSPDRAPAGLHDSMWTMRDIDALVSRPGSDSQP